MPDNLCRACGGDLIKLSTCSDCKKITQRICKMCSEKTTEAFHLHHAHLEYHRVTEQDSLATVQDYIPTVHKNPKPVRHSRKHLKPTLAMCIIVGIIISGMYVTSYSESHLNPNLSDDQVSVRHEMPPIPAHPVQVHPIGSSANIVQPSTETSYTYTNCIGVSDGMQLTVTCPTEYGTPYKAVVRIPAELIIQLETDVFNLREISVTEHAYSISMQYAKKTYEAQFVNS